MTKEEARKKIRADLLSIIGYTGEISWPNSEPRFGYFTDRYLYPVLERLVDYVQDNNKENK